MKISRHLGLYSLLCVVSVGVVIFLTPIKSDNTVASTNHFKSPQICTSMHVPSVYHSRFHPKFNFSYTVPYRIHSARRETIKNVRPNYPIWNRPYVRGAYYTSTTTSLADNNQPVELGKVADNNAHKFYSIISGGHFYGWVPAAAIQDLHGSYHLPFHYYSQLYPTYAPDACEAVALRMALSVKGRDPHISMKKFISRVPRNHNPDLGYNANPFHLGDHASIYPPALAKYGHRYDKHTADVTGITEHQIIHEISHGNPVVFEGSWLMHDTTSDHTLVLIGYSAHDGYFEFADPYHRRSDHTKPISFVDKSQFDHIFTSDRRGLRAVVVR